MVDKFVIIRNHIKEFVTKRKKQKEVMQYYWGLILQRYQVARNANRIPKTIDLTPK